MATSLVNLDALIVREDFLVPGNESAEGNAGTTIRINDLVAGAFFYSALRKPDFQRETANWSPQKIQDFIKTFLAGDLIPAVICWTSGGSNVFVIDGAHRLSALIAWINDDYGAGVLSRRFFHDDIPPEQLRAAKKTSELISTTIGTYADHVIAATNPNARSELRERANRLASFALTLQWVPSKDAKKAEAAFFKINQQATPIDPTELRILQDRFSPNAITSRVIVRNATGHKYWGSFSVNCQSEIETIGKDIYKNLFTPPLDTPIKTLDLPVAGRGYSGQTLPLIFDFVNIANELPVIEATKNRKASSEEKSIDGDGVSTLKMLKKTRGLVQRITGLDPSSLGLHPVVYFYSASGRYQPTAFLAMASLLMEIEQKNQFKEFTNVRQRFEDFLLAHKNYVNQITTKFGSGGKGFLQVKNLYSLLLTELGRNQTAEQIIKALGDHPTFSFLSKFDGSDALSEGKKLSTAVKSVAFLKQALGTPMRCNICHGLIHFNSIQVDHITKKADGGLAVAANAQLSHPYCNSTVKG